MLTTSWAAALRAFATQLPFGGLLSFVDRLDNPYRAAYEGATFTEMLKFTEIEMGRGVFGKAGQQDPWR